LEAEQLFDLIQATIQSELDKTENRWVYLERETRGTYPTLIVRVLPSERTKKPKPGSMILAPQKAPQERTEPSPAPSGDPA
jgi:hypothetical protein